MAERNLAGNTVNFQTQVPGTDLSASDVRRWDNRGCSILTVQRQIVEDHGSRTTLESRRTLAGNFLPC